MLTCAFPLGLLSYGLTPALPWLLVFAARTPVQRWSGWLLTLVGFAACGYIALNETALSDQYGYLVWR